MDKAEKVKMRDKIKQERLEKKEALEDELGEIKTVNKIYDELNKGNPSDAKFDKKFEMWAVGIQNMKTFAIANKVVKMVKGVSEGSMKKIGQGLKMYAFGKKVQEGKPEDAIKLIEKTPTYEIKGKIKKPKK